MHYGFHPFPAFPSCGQGRLFSLENRLFQRDCSCRQCDITMIRYPMLLICIAIVNPIKLNCKPGIKTLASVTGKADFIELKTLPAGSQSGQSKSTARSTDFAFKPGVLDYSFISISFFRFDENQVHRVCCLRWMKFPACQPVRFESESCGNCLRLSKATAGMR